MDSSDLAYIAGFWEGEGSAGFYSKGKGQRRLEVTVFQKDTRILYWLKENFGGIIRTTRSCSSWAIRYERAREFLLKILPYLRCRNDYVDSLLSANPKKVKSILG